MGSANKQLAKTPLHEKLGLTPKISKKSSYADTFDYNYKTNPYMIKIAGPIVGRVIRFLYKVKYEGLENVPRDKNFILMPNHISHMDSFVCGPPLTTWGPIHAIVDEKLFKSREFRIFAKLLNGFPVRKGAKAIHVVQHAIRRVKGGNSLLWYPEGQRHKNPSENRCNPGKLGTGIIAHAVKANIIPIFIAGAEFAMPVGKGLKFGKRLRSINMLVRYGKPVPLEDLRALPASKQTSQRVVDRIMEHIEKMRCSYVDQSHRY